LNKYKVYEYVCNKFGDGADRNTNSLQCERTMNKILIVLTFAFILSCASTGPGGEIKNPKTGWVDEDTYTVTAVADTVEKAVERAKFQVLKDIVDVRVRDKSKYTDIEKIQGEFYLPLKNGTVISKKNVPGGVKIYFQIKEKGLREKFQRK
jgi:hypothetical protein